MTNKLKRQLIKLYLKLIPRKQRDLRIEFVGKRLKFKQDHWLERDQCKKELKESNKC